MYHLNTCSGKPCIHMHSDKTTLHLIKNMLSLSVVMIYRVAKKSCTSLNHHTDATIQEK